MLKTPRSLSGARTPIWLKGARTVIWSRWKDIFDNVYLSVLNKEKELGYSFMIFWNFFYDQIDVSYSACILEFSHQNDIIKWLQKMNRSQVGFHFLFISFSFSFPFLSVFHLTSSVHFLKKRSWNLFLWKKIRISIFNLPFDQNSMHHWISLLPISFCIKWYPTYRTYFLNISSE